MGSLSFDRDAFSDTVMAASLKPSWTENLIWEQVKQKQKALLAWFFIRYFLDSNFYIYFNLIVFVKLCAFSDLF